MTIEKIRNLFYEGQLFGKPNLYGSNQNTVGPKNTGGGGWAGAFTNTGKKGETTFGVIEEEDELSIDKASEELDKTTSDASETPSDDNSETPSEDSSESNPDSTEDTPDESQDSKEDTQETPQETPETAPVQQKIQETPEQKINKMFSDTNDVNNDYSLTNENNIRLEKFKSINSGLELEKIIPEDELKNGISSRDVISLLTPSQIDIFKEKNRELRKKYPLIDKREKNIIIHNSNVPIFSMSEEGHQKEIDDNNKRQAYDKINSYMEQNFGKNWQDKSKAIEFLRTIKINFNDNPAIRANLLDVSSMIVEEGENYKIPLDKINVFTPTMVTDFIKVNKEDPFFTKSNIFRTLLGSYNQENGSKGQLSVIFNDENIKGKNDSEDSGKMDSEDTSESPSEETPEETPSDTGEGEQSTEDELDSAVENAVPKLPVG